MCGPACALRPYPLDKLWLTVLKQNKHIGGAVEVDIDKLFPTLPGRGFEILDHVDGSVEIPIDLSPHEHIVLIGLLDIRETVEV